MPIGKASRRFVLNAAGGGKVTGADIERLRAAGIDVNGLNPNISVAEFDQVARTLLVLVAGSVP
jgi:hypothetical protein